MWCNLSAGPEVCPMTVLAQIVNRFYASLSVAGIAFYFGTWAFIAMFVLGIAVSAWLAKRSNTEHVEEDLDELDDYIDDDDL